MGYCDSELWSLEELGLFTQFLSNELKLLSNDDRNLLFDALERFVINNRRGWKGTVVLWRDQV